MELWGDQAMAAHSDMALESDNVAMFTFCKFIVLLHFNATSVALFCFTFKFCVVFFILN